MKESIKEYLECLTTTTNNLPRIVRTVSLVLLTKNQGLFKKLKLYLVKIGSECFGETVDSACRWNFTFVRVFGGVNPHDRYACIFILEFLNFFIFSLSFHVCRSFWRRDPTPSEAMHFKLNQIWIPA